MKSQTFSEKFDRLFFFKNLCNCCGFSLFSNCEQIKKTDRKNGIIELFYKHAPLKQAVFGCFNRTILELRHNFRSHHRKAGSFRENTEVRSQNFSECFVVPLTHRFIGGVLMYFYKILNRFNGL